MRLNGFDSCRHEPRSRSLLSRGIGEIQAQLLMTIDRHRFDGLDDLEGKTRSGQAEYRSVAAIALAERGAQWKADQVAVEADGFLEMRRTPGESERADRTQFLRPAIARLT